MKVWIHKLLNRGNTCVFEKADLTESTAALQNPARGFYRLYSFLAENEPDLESVKWSLDETATLALVIIDIGAYREKKLDQPAIEHMKAILDFFAERKLDIILRIAYDHQGNALEREPFFFAQITEHLRQLLPILNRYKGNLFVFQGMLIGNWGEMHTSRFLATSKLKEMWNLLQETDKRIFYAVRRPVQWRLLHPDECVNMTLPCDNMGLFDDAIFGSDSNLGTFGTVAKEYAGWDGMWSREDELQFEDLLCRYVPNGGEVICGEQYAEERNIAKTIDVLRRMHITYLNKDYDKRILDIWAELKWPESGVWFDKSLLEYIGSHLGYRFWVKDAKITPDKNNPSGVLLTIRIENVGFANFYQDAEVILELEETEGTTHVMSLQTDLRSWDCQKTITLTYVIKQTDCKIYLSAKRTQDNKKIYFANQDGTDRVLLGTLDSGCR